MYLISAVGINKTSASGFSSRKAVASGGGGGSSIFFFAKATLADCSRRTVERINEGTIVATIYDGAVGEQWRRKLQCEC